LTYCIGQRTFDADVVARIDEAVTAAGLNCSAFMRNCILQVMEGA